MAWPAGLGRFGISVTFFARYRIDARIDSVAADVISAVGHPPICVSLVFDGRLQFGPDPVTIVAKVRFMTHVADFDLLGRNRAVVFHEYRGVHITPVGHIRIRIIMAVCTVFKVFALLLRVKRWWVPPFLGGRTGQYKTDQAADQTNA